MRLFHDAYRAQMDGSLDTAISLYTSSIETFPTAEAFTFRGWVYSFQGRYREAIGECERAIATDPTLGNPYNDIGCYLIELGDWYSCAAWFERALRAPRYESYAFPHFNLGRVYERHGRLLEAARHYQLALREQRDFANAVKALRRVQARLN
jgi:Tfp pilus assembly protein PilF